MRENLKKNKYKIIAGILCVILLIVFYKYYSRYIYIFTDIKEIKNKILSFGTYSWLAFLLLQIMQIVIFIIPGEIIQVAAGYIFGTWVGFGLSLIGAIIGSSITFLLSKKLGKPFVEKLVSKKDLWLLKKIEHYKVELSAKKVISKDEKDKHKSLKRIVLVLYLIPGIPKDVLGYICGISSLSLKEFLVISNVARIPMLYISIFFGHNLSWDKLSVLIIVAVIVCILLVIGIFKSKKLVSSLGEDENKGLDKTKDGK